jgi:hypothetical protein
MEEQFSNQDELVKKMIKGMPLEQPSSDFTQKVMQRVLKQAAKNIYRPLISKKAWWIIASMFFIGTLWLYYNPGTSIINTDSIPWENKLTFKNPLENLHLSKTAIYAIGFMALFLLQIPFLKRLLDKRYS